jgi:hypothetical protein
MLLQMEAAFLRDRLLAAFDLGIEEFLDAAAIEAHEVIVVEPSLSSNTALPDSKLLRDSRPACSNCVSTR